MSPEDVEQLIVQRDRLLAENTGLRAENATMRATTHKYVESNAEEMQRIAKSSAELLGHLETRQAEGDRLRSRLRKVLDAYEACDALLTAVEACDGSARMELIVHDLRQAYSKTKLELTTVDG